MDPTAAGHKGVHVAPSVYAGGFVSPRLAEKTQAISIDGQGFLLLHPRNVLCRSAIEPSPPPHPPTPFSTHFDRPPSPSSSELRSDITGKVVRFLQEDGADVASGDPFVEVEAMKMIMPLKATESGKINHEMSPGSIIAAGDLLASLQLAVRGLLVW